MANAKLACKLCYYVHVQLIRKNKKLIIFIAISVAFCLTLFIVACYYLIEPNRKYITTLENSKEATVGMVLGAGIAPNGKPYNELKARLDVAAKAIKQGKVKKLILSGDNRFKNYDEPTSMKLYLQNKGWMQTT